MHDIIIVMINSLGFSKDNKLVVYCLGKLCLSSPIVHVYRWFRTLVFCPGLYENSSLPESRSPLCYGGSTTS